MRGLGLAFVLVMGFASSGCTTTIGQAANLVVAGKWTRFRPAPPPVTPDGIVLQYVKLECEANNPTISDVIWRTGDDHFLTPNQRTQLAKNGLRFSKLTGDLGPDMLRLLAKDKQKLDAHSHQTRAGTLVKIQMTENLPKWNLLRVVDGAAVGENLTDAQGILSITPTLGSNNRLQLAVAPTIEFGEQKRFTVPTANLSGFEIKCEREARVFNELKFELDLASGDYLLVSCVGDQAGSLGHTMFIRDQNSKKMQSLMLIRAIRPSREDLFQSGFDINDFFLTPEANEVSTRSPVRETVLISRPGAMKVATGSKP